MTIITSEKGLAGTDYLQRAEALREQLAAGAAEADQNRGVSPENVDAISDAGLTALWAPAAFGGPQASIRTQVDVTRAIGQGDMSAGWLVGVNNAANFAFGLFGEQAKQEIWADGKPVRGAGVLAPAGSSEVVEGGIRLSGAWKYMSGVTYADWVFVTAPLNGGMGPDMELGFVLLRRDEISVEDTWFTTGLRGTASQTAVVQDLFVPEHRILRWRDYRAESFEGIYRSGLFSVLCICLVSTVVGEVESALQFVIDKAPTRPIVTTTYRAQTDSASFQVELSRAASLLQSARLTLENAADQMDAIIESGRTPTEVEKAQNRVDCAYIVTAAWEAVDALASAHGTSTFAQGNPLERIWRNAGVGARHAGLSERVASEIYGRALLGLDPNVIGPGL